MTYTAEISRNNPTAMLFVIDQSASMDEAMPTGRSKAQFVADVLNRNLMTTVIKCQRDDGVRNYFEIGVIGYGGRGVHPGLKGALAHSVFHPLSEIEAHPLRVEDRRKKVDDGAGGIIEQTAKFPVWFDPTNDGGTPMSAALTMAAHEIAVWSDAHKTSYPPTVIHVSDGQWNDSDPADVAATLRQLSTDDGEALLFNLHVDIEEGNSIMFPDSEFVLPDDWSKQLFRMSSVMPPHLVLVARDKGYKVSSESRFFAYQADIQSIVDFFDIGTRAANLR